MSVAGTEAFKVRVLDRVSYICYPVQFRKNKGKDVLTLLDSGNEVNAMTPAYTAHLSLKVRVTDVGAQKIKRCSLATYGMVIAAFQIVNKLGRSWFFQKTFLLAAISMEVVLVMSFLTLSNADIWFAEKELIWRSYITKNALLTNRQVKIINQKKFANRAFDENAEAFVVYVSSLGSRMNIHSARKARLALLLTKKVTVPTEYLNFADVFLKNPAKVFPERTKGNEYAIKLEEGK